MKQRIRTRGSSPARTFKMRLFILMRYLCIYFVVTAVWYGKLTCKSGGAILK